MSPTQATLKLFENVWKSIVMATRQVRYNSRLCIVAGLPGFPYIDIFFKASTSFT